MKHTIRNLLRRLRRKKDPDAAAAALEAERDFADAKRDALVEAQRREVTRG